MTENSPDGTGSQPEPPKLPGDHADSGTGQQPGTSRTDDVAESGQPEQAPAEQLKIGATNWSPFTCD